MLHASPFAPREKALLVALLVALAACDDAGAPPCVQMPAMSDLLTGAALVRVDVYDGATVDCAGTIASTTAAPLLTRTFAGGQSLRLDIPPGLRVVVLTTFSDAEGTIPLGGACTEAELGGGSKACLSFDLQVLDAGVVGACSSADDCTVAPLLKCETTRARCVECLGTADCTAPAVCSASGRCGLVCDASNPCADGRTCCDGLCLDTRNDPLHCGGCGMACSGGETLCCNGVCANPSVSVEHCGACGNACSTFRNTPTCSGGSCVYGCESGHGHCASGNTGCETATDTVDDCGGCGNACVATNAMTNACGGTQCSYTCKAGFLDCIKVGANTDGCESTTSDVTSCGGCGNVCDSINSTGATCPSGSCQYTGCAPGRFNCDTTAPDLDGCECTTAMCCGSACQPVHTNGLGDSYLLDCTALGTPGNAGTYTLAMANAAANAWSKGTAAPGTRTCGNGSNKSDCVTRQGATTCGVWCYNNKLPGRVLEAASCTGACPTASSPSWN